MHAPDSPITQWEVLVHTTPDDTVRGVFRFDKGQPTLVLESGEIISSEMENVSFSVESEIVVGDLGKSEFSKLRERIRINLKPCVVRNLPYATFLASVDEDIYPPSTHNWYGRYMMAPTEPLYSYEQPSFTYLIQEIQGQDQYWLTIVNADSGIIYESHTIHHYEEPIIRMSSNMDIWKQRVVNTFDLNKQALSILDGPPPSWNELTFLARGVSIPELKVRETMGLSLNPLIPESVPQEQREEIKAFLALALSIKKIPSIDPTEYLLQYMGTPLLRDLLSIHLRILAQGSAVPDYVALMFAAEQGVLDEKLDPEGPKVGVIRGLRTMLLKPPYYRPYWNEILKHINTMNSDKRISINLPIGKSKARKSPEAWLSRIEHEFGGTTIFINPNYRAMGLGQLVYYGSAHSWVHRHLAWYAKGTDVTHSLSPVRTLQVMVMPPLAAQQVKRVMTNVSDVEWYSRIVNLNLYDGDSRNWIVDIDKILSSIQRKCTITQLKKKFQLWSNKSSIKHNLTIDEAKAIDAIKSRLYLVDLELYGPERFCGLTSKQLLDSLDKLKSLGLVGINYEHNKAVSETCQSYIFLASGLSEYVCSVARAFLSLTPSSLVFLTNDATQVYIVSRLPKTAAYQLIQNILSPGEMEGINIRCNNILGYRDYQHNLLQRILTKNGWDSDASELLSQARLS